MSRHNLIYRIAGDFISLLFPKLCQCCGEHLVRNEEIICLTCMVDIPLTGFHTVRENSLEKSLWGRCYVERAAAWAFYQRGGKVQTLVHRLKYLGIKDIGLYAGRMYGYQLLDSDFLSGIDAIVPVPLHPSRERRRGFNQAAVICEGISAVTSIPVRTDILSRKVRTPTQTRKSRVERWENVENIFSLHEGSVTEGMHILLVDDVITTGSTIEACVNAIRESADTRVSVVSLAFAVSSPI